MGKKAGSKVWLWVLGGVLLLFTGCCGSWVLLMAWAAGEGREIQEREAAVAREQEEELRRGAPAALALARTEMEAAHAAMTAGNHAEAITRSEGARRELAELVSLHPAFDGVVETDRDAAALIDRARSAQATESDARERAEAAAREVQQRAEAEARNLAAIQETLDQADAVVRERPGDDVIVYDHRLEVLRTTLSAAGPSAREQHGRDIDRRITAIDRRRSSIRSQVERAEIEQRAREIYAAMCGSEPPVLGPWDGELMGAERVLAETANDPDSIDVERCTQPVLTSDDCWTTTCNVRGRNAFGALVLNRYRFSVGARNTIINYRRL